MKRFLLGAICLFASSCFAVTVQLASPTANATSPIHIQATASSSRAISGWHVYVDSKDSYAGPAASSINTYISAAAGTHTVVVRAWDTSGAYGDQTVKVTVGTATSTKPVTVSVSSPVAYSSVTSPLSLNASASSSNSVVGWHVYVDSVDSYTGGATSSISANLNASQGTHTIVVRAWDSTGAYGDQTLQATVSGTSGSTSTGLPTPPSTAKVFSNIEQMTGWGSCHDAGCAGGSGSGTFWQALNQSSPSMDGNSMHIYNSGTWANALWWKHLGANNSATNMLWDFYVYLDSSAASNAQSLEYDPFQFVGGWNYMIGTQCNYAAAVWDTWNENTQQWLHTSVPCPRFSAGAWHHIQMYVTTNHTNHTYTYKTFVVDGKSYTVNQTQPAKYLGWGDNLGVQWQLDVNASGGGVHEWVDKAKLTIW